MRSEKFGISSIAGKLILHLRRNTKRHIMNRSGVAGVVGLIKNVWILLGYLSLYYQFSFWAIWSTIAIKDFHFLRVFNISLSWKTYGKHVGKYSKVDTLLTGVFNRRKFFYWLGLTPCKAEETLRGMELQEQEEEKD